MLPSASTGQRGRGRRPAPCLALLKLGGGGVVLPLVFG